MSYPLHGYNLKQIFSTFLQTTLAHYYDVLCGYKQQKESGSESQCLCNVPASRMSLQ